MSIPDFLSKQDSERQHILKGIHSVIIEHDKTVIATVGKMMGKEMILYKAKGFFKYGLSGVKNYMSLHAMPIYASPKLHARYEALLNKAKFQKGCINFKSAEEMPPEIVTQLIADCSKIDLLAIMNEYKANKKKK